MKRLKLFIFLIVLAVIAFGVFTTVRSQDMNPVTLGIYENLGDGHSYYIRVPVWKIGRSQADTDLFLCIKESVGFGGDLDPVAGGTDTYNEKLNVRSVSDFNSLYSTSVNHNAVLWLIDNLFDKTHAESAELYRRIVASVTSSDLTDTQIEAVYRAAIWHFTDGLEWAFPQLDDMTGTAGNAIDPLTGDAMRELYEFLIGKAVAGASIYGNGTLKPIPGEGNDFENVSTTKTWREVGENIVVGPFRMTETGSSKIINDLYLHSSLSASITNQSNTSIAGAKITDASGTETAAALDTDFYVSFPKTNTSVTGVKVAFSVDYYVSDAEIWTNSANRQGTQSVVKVTKVKKTMSTQDEYNQAVVVKEFDLSLRKYITQVNGRNISDTRVPNINLATLNTATTAAYNHRKKPVQVNTNDVVTYQITIYNEGQVDGRAIEVIDQLPTGLQFMSVKLGDYTAETIENNQVKLTKIGTENLAAYNGTTLDSETITIECKVTAEQTTTQQILTNIAWIHADNVGTDRDSSPSAYPQKANSELSAYNGNTSNKADLADDAYYYKGQQDEDDFEKLLIQPKGVEFDLALRKFITAINTVSPSTSREPIVDITDLAAGTSKTATYTHPKDPLLIKNGDIVEYTIRIYNETDMDGTASKIVDDIPNGLKFLEDHETNIAYEWTLDGEKVYTEYLANETIAKFDGTKLDYKDVKIAFEVDIAAIPEYDKLIITNTAEIAEDENAKDVEDRDSIPGNDNREEEEDQFIEDDIDQEHLKPQIFDLGLRKWVVQAILTVDGKTTVIDSGHTAEMNPELDFSVVLDSKKLKTTTLKFKYLIRVDNQGQIAGYAKEVKDHIPAGLKFVAEDNPDWKEISEGVIVTEKIKDVLLQPGDVSEEIELILTWENDANNVARKVNYAEISKDHNDTNTPDVDSDPDNFDDTPKEDDEDEAPVLVEIKLGAMALYIILPIVVLTMIGIGIVAIKKKVL